MVKNNQEIDDMTIEEFEKLILSLKKDDLLIERVSIAERFKKPIGNKTLLDCLGVECKDYPQRNEKCKALVRR